MKNRIRPGMAALCSLLSLLSFGQQPVRQVLPFKPMLFSRLPEKSIITASQLGRLFTAGSMQTVNIPLGAGNFLEGIVRDKTAKNKNVTSVTIQCTNYDGALLTISRITGNNSSCTYIGRVVNIQYGDVLLLTQKNNQYFLMKEKQSLVIVE